MDSDDEIQLFLQAVQRGDHDAVGRLFDQYFERLVVLARRRLPVRYAKMRDGEDVAQSVFESFVRRAQQGNFPELRRECELAALLFTMVRRRVSKYVEYETRERRNQDKTISFSMAHRSLDESVDGTAHDVSRDKRIAPAGQSIDSYTTLMVEEIEGALQSLDTDRQRHIARLILEGQTMDSISNLLDVHVSTVYRTYDRILDIWKARTDE